MAQKETETGPSLELPSLFGRRKRRGEPSAAEEPTAGPAPVEQTTAAPSTVEQPRPTLASVADAPETSATTEISHDREATEVIPAVEPEPSEPTAHAPAVTPTPVPTHPPAEPSSTPVSAGPAIGTSTAAGASTSRTEKRAGGRRRARASRRTVPEVAATTAAFLVGALVGLAGSVLTWLGLQGCELVTGTNSCGGPGLLVLIAILVAMVLLGAFALRTLRVPDASNVSFLGVGILTVLALVFMAEYLYDPWMFVIVPAVTAASFAVARWVTTLYAEDVIGDDDDNGMPHHDIR